MQVVFYKRSFDAAFSMTPYIYLFIYVIVM